MRILAVSQSEPDAQARISAHSPSLARRARILAREINCTPLRGARRICRARFSDRRPLISSSAVGARRHSRKCEPPGFVRNSAGLPLAHCAPPPTSALAAERRTAARPTGGIAALRPPATEEQAFGLRGRARQIRHAPIADRRKEKRAAERTGECRQVHYFTTL